MQITPFKRIAIAFAFSPGRVALLTEARRLIESVFIRTGGAASRTHVHFISVENVPLITVEGDVVSPVTMPAPPIARIQVGTLDLAPGTLPVRQVA